MDNTHPQQWTSDDSVARIASLTRAFRASQHLVEAQRESATAFQKEAMAVVDALAAERDRYRQALAEIEGKLQFSSTMRRTFAECREIAQEAIAHG